MKRNLIYVAMSTVLLAGCVQQEDVFEGKESKIPDSAGTPIGFSIVDEAGSRVTVTNNDNLSFFRVWGGYVDNNSTQTINTVFNGDLVTKQTSDNGEVAWVYDNPKPWLQGKSYFFSAIGWCVDPKGSYGYEFTSSNDSSNDVDYLDNHLGVLTYHNDKAKGDCDLVFATAKTEDVNSDTKYVEFNFQHVLSKFSLKFVNKIDDEKYTILISNVKITSAATGTLNLESYPLDKKTPDMEWTDISGSFPIEVSFPNVQTNDDNTSGEILLASGKYIESTDYCLIPNQEKITVSFDAYLKEEGNSYYGPCKKSTFDITPADIDKTAFQPGHSYNLVAHFTKDNFEKQITTSGDSDNNGTNVDDYIEDVYYDITFNTPLTISTSYDNEDRCYTELSVIEISPTTESVYLGEQESGRSEYSFGRSEYSFEPSEYSYEWEVVESTDKRSDIWIDKSASFTNQKQTVTLDRKSVNNTGEIKIYVSVPGNFTNNDKKIYIKLTIKDSNGESVASATATVTINYTPSTTTGGSQDGDDNDG